MEAEAVDLAYVMTSGDIARMLEVDLKTVHNWVKHGHLVGRRTPGRHLRFLRPEVVRFLRTFGYEIPKELGDPPARVALVGLGIEKRTSGTRLAVRSFSADHFAGLFEAVMAVGNGDYEVVVLALDRYPVGLVAELVDALRSRDLTQGIALLGISRQASVRDGFLDCGGDIAITDSTELRAAVRWLIGAGDLPDACVTRIAMVAE